MKPFFVERILLSQDNKYSVLVLLLTSFIHFRFLKIY